MAIQTIAKEKVKKQTRKVYLVLGVILAIIYAFLVFHFMQTKALNPKLSITELMTEVTTHIQEYPFDISLYAVQQSLFFLGVSYALAAVFVIMRSTTRALNKHDNPETVNGEARFMTMEDLKQYNMRRTDPFGKPTSDGPKNMILSRDMKLAIDNAKTRRNLNTLVIGGSGAGKSRFFVSPNILQYNSNYVITDPSGELLRDYGKSLEDNGYAVKVFNLTDVYRSSRYNPFNYIKTEKDIFTCVSTLIKNTNPSEGKAGDPFWENSEKLLITSLMLYLWHTAPPKDQNFTKLTQLVNMAKLDENDESAQTPLDTLFDDLEREDKTNLAVQQYKKFKLAAGKTVSSILISVGVRLQSFDLSDIRYLTSGDDLDLYNFSDTKQALFVIIPTADTTFNFLVSMMYSQLFSSLYYYCETEAEYGWQAYIDDLNIIKVEHGNSRTTNEAKAKIEDFVKEVKNGTKAEYDKDKKLYYIYTNSGTLVGWRGTKEMANEFQARLKDIKIRKSSSKCPNHVRMLLDEFANIGQIPDFDQLLATMRKYDISCAIILQAISQLEVLYKDKWNTIAANCDEKLFLGCDDTKTIKWIVEKMGKRTTVVQNTSYNDKSGSISYNHSSIDLITVDQVSMMKDNECMVTVRGEHPYYGPKYELTQHPNYEYAMKTKGQFKVPLMIDEGEKESLNTPLRLSTESSFNEDNIEKKEQEIYEANLKAKDSQRLKDNDKVVNKMKKQRAEKAKEDMKKVEKEEAKIRERSQSKSKFEDNTLEIAESLGIDASELGSTPKEILLERIESAIVLETVNTDDVNYSATN